MQATEQTTGSGISRREAIRRAALLAGVVLSPEWLSLVDRVATPAAQTVSLTPAQATMVSAIADRIIPRTDTPGAADVGVPAFIDLLYGQFMTDAERKLLTDGLAEVEAAARSAQGGSFATLAESLRAKGIKTKLYYGARRAEELFFLDWFERIGVHLELTTEDGSRIEAGPARGSRAWVPVRGRVTIPLERDLKARPKSANVMVYACGPEAMLAAVARIAATHGRPSQVSVERVMGCGLGGCYSCVIPIKTPEGKPHHVRSCIAGPVFRGDEIAWQ